MLNNLNTNNTNKLKNYLLENGFELNSSDINVYDNPKNYYYKNPILVMFQEDNSVVIKSLLDNRKYDFNENTSDFLLIEFLKYLENNFNFVV